MSGDDLFLKNRKWQRRSGLSGAGYTDRPIYVATSEWNDNEGTLLSTPDPDPQKDRDRQAKMYLTEKEFCLSAGEPEGLYPPAEQNPFHRNGCKPLGPSSTKPYKLGNKEWPECAQQG
jgi:hypothetical protein